MPRGGKTSGSFKKGEAKGKPKGAVNRTTKESKQLLEQILFGQVDNIEAAFNKLQKDPARYLDACSKLFAYILPKKTDVTSDNKPIIQLPTIEIKTNGH